MVSSVSLFVSNVALLTKEVLDDELGEFVCKSRCATHLGGPG